MEQYPDSDSVALVVAGSEVLGKSPGALLEELGRYWIEFALESDYGDLLKMSGNNLAEVLANLDQMHVRIGHSFPNLQPPSFWVTDQTEDSLVLHYSSTREGLSSFVVGLIHGLGKMFDKKCEVEIIAPKNEENDHDQFSVKLLSTN